MKILLIAEFFAPLTSMASIRPTKIAKYMKINGNHQITLITTKKTVAKLGEADNYVDKIIEIERGFIVSMIENLRNKRRMEKTNTNSNYSNMNFTINESSKRYALRFIINFHSSADFYKNTVKTIKNVNLSDYDVVISTYGPFATHQIARYIKKRYPKIKWVSDFRDQVYNVFFTPFGFKNYSKNFARKVCKNANVITAVSDGVMEELYLSEKQKNRYILPNGFDLDDFSNIKAEKYDYFTLSYLGSIYRGNLRDLTPVFKSLVDLIRENKIDRNKIRIIYAGHDGYKFLAQINKYSLNDITIFYDNIDRNKALQIEISSHILLLASWNFESYKGVITGKFFEYMAANRPIICTITGDTPNSALKKMIKKANIGICYEEVNKERDYLLLKKYILEQYNNFILDKEPIFNPNREYIEQFNYKNIVYRLEEIINEL